MKCWNLSTNRPMSYEGRIKEKRTLVTRILSSVPGPGITIRKHIETPTVKCNDNQ